MNPYYPNLFSAFTIRGHTFKNRILMAPFLPQNGDENGIPSDYGMAYYEERARGGAAQLTIGETPVDFDRASRKNGGFIDLTRDNYLVREVCMISELTAMMHQHGALACIELSHIGLWNMPQTIRDGKNPVGPSAMIRPDGVRVEELDEAQMEEIAAHFAHAAQNAKSFGFDSVMVHGGHGWLQSQFLSPLFNRRKDKYGGSLENRSRFPLMILHAVREAIGDDMILEYRISADELVPGGTGVEDSIAFLQLAEPWIDLIHVSVGCYQDPVNTRTFPSVYEPYGCNAYLAESVKKAVSTPVAVVGAINTPDVAERIIFSGQADFVAIAKQLIADPEFPRKARQGRAEDIVPCIRCYRCMGIPGKSPNVFCSVNPLAGREARAPFLQPKSTGKRVLIVGGGPGGMSAALTAASEGHRVTLCEGSGALGGELRFADHDLHKKDIQKYRDYLIRSVERTKNIEIRLGAFVTGDYLEREKPDACIIAIGADPVHPPIKGVDRPFVLNASDAYGKAAQLGRRVVIVGAGLVGCELAVFLRDQGKKVTVLCSGDSFAPDCVLFSRMALDAQLKNGIRMEYNTRATEITEDAVIAGSYRFPADSVILACGMRARETESKQLAEVIPESARIGDCVCPGRIIDAVHGGYYAALDV